MVRVEVVIVMATEVPKGINGDQRGVVGENNDDSIDITWYWLTLVG